MFEHCHSPKCSFLSLKISLSFLIFSDVSFLASCSTDLFPNTAKSVLWKANSTLYSLELNASCLTSSLLQCNLFCNTHACCCYSAISDLPSSNMHACMLRLEEKIKVHFRRKIMLKDLCQYFTGSSGEKTKLCLIYQKSLSCERIKIQNVL